MLSPVIGHETNAVQLWGVQFPTTAWCMLHNSPCRRVFVEDFICAGHVGTSVCMFGWSFGPIPCFQVVASAVSPARADKHRRHIGVHDKAAAVVDAPSGEFDGFAAFTYRC